MSGPSIPTAAAVVVAPIRKLCPEYRVISGFKASLSLATSISLDKGTPDTSLKKGPSAQPLIAKYAAIAATGHVLYV